MVTDIIIYPGVHAPTGEGCEACTRWAKIEENLRIHDSNIGKVVSIEVTKAKRDVTVWDYLHCVEKLEAETVLFLSQEFLPLPGFVKSLQEAYQGIVASSIDNHEGADIGSFPGIIGVEGLQYTDMLTSVSTFYDPRKVDIILGPCFGSRELFLSCNRLAHEIKIRDIPNPVIHLFLAHVSMLCHFSNYIVFGPHVTFYAPKLPLEEFENWTIFDATMSRRLQTLYQDFIKNEGAN